MGKGERKGRKGKKKGGELFQSSPYPLSFLQPGCGGGASPLLPSFPITWRKRRRASSLSLSSSPLFGFHPCPSLPLLPRSLRTQEEDCQEGVSSVCPLSSFIFCFAFPCPSLPFSIFLGIAPKGGGGGGRIGKRGNKRFAKTKGRLKLAKKY